MKLSFILLTRKVQLFSRAWLTIALTMSVALPVNSEQNKVHSLKAAYVYYFARFTSWESHSSATSGKNISVCLHGVSDKIHEQFIAISEKSKTSSTPININQVDINQPESLASCDILYSTDESSSFSLKETGLLIVTETEEKQHKGIINFVLDGSKLGFEINRNKAKSAQLKISSKLLRLATRIIE